MVQMYEGAWYRRRDGKVVGPAVRYDDDVYEWEVGNNTYTDIGSCWESGRTADVDLIEQVPAPDAAPSTTSAPVPGFPGDLRDWFAGMALAREHRNVPSFSVTENAKATAERCYIQADAMIAQRNKEKAE